MKHIKQDFSLKACVRYPRLTELEGDQNSTFSEYVHISYRIKEMSHVATW